MLRGFYTTANGMLAMQRKQEVLSNNMANANTPGFKADQPAVRAFPEILLQQVGTAETPIQNGLQRNITRPIGSIHTGVYIQETMPHFDQGTLNQTGLSTDLALVQTDLPDETGSLFFTVQTEAGEERLTRNGNFTVDGQGFLVTNEGYYVLDGAGNPIETNGLDFTVSKEGLITSGDGEMELGIVYVPDANELEKEGNNLYSGDSEAVPEEAVYSVHQGELERSNVDTLQTMTEMMNTYRLFEVNQRALRAYDQSMERAVNDIGRLG